MKIKIINLKYNAVINVFVAWRFNYLLIFILILLLTLILRTAYLQLIDTKRLINRGDMYSMRICNIPVIRGTISDRFGRLLAINTPMYDIWINPKEINMSSSIKNNINWKKLSYILNLSLEHIYVNINLNSKKKFVYLARQVNSTVNNYIIKLKLPGVYSYQTLQRYYPTKEITANLIGITNIDNQGIEGIEKSFDNILSGKAGIRQIRKDRFGRIIENTCLIQHKTAKNIILSIDIRLQELIFNEIDKAVKFHKADSGIAVLVDVNTGEVLAMANSPSYNPNYLKNFMQNNMRNRAITDIFEPGSIIKPVVIMAALKENIIKENSTLNTASYKIQGYKIQDTIDYNKLTITEILQKSSNVGVSKLALAMSKYALLENYANFGLGKTTNLGLIGENRGLLYFNNKKKLSNVERVVLSYGYGFMVTVSQLARLYAAIGSMGVLRPLSIVKIDTPIPGTRIFSESLTRKVVNMLETVALPGGSGVKAAIKNYRIAVKTGTVKKVNAHGKYINQYVSYAAGIAPASNPRFALIILINNPQNGKYYGGIVSAPIFSTIMSNVLKIMKIKPDALLYKQKFK